MMHCIEAVQEEIHFAVKGGFLSFFFLLHYTGKAPHDHKDPNIISLQTRKVLGLMGHMLNLAPHPQVRVFGAHRKMEI